MSEKRDFDNDLLDNCLERDEATLISIKYSDDRNLLNRDAKITYRCKCGCIKDDKTFRSCVDYGFYCDTCMIPITVERRGNTLEKIHGKTPDGKPIRNPNDIPGVQEQINNTIIANGGANKRQKIAKVMLDKRTQQQEEQRKLEKETNAKECSSCKKTKTLDLFHIKIFKSGEEGRISRCIECIKEQTEANRQRCKTDLCETRVDNRYEGYCIRCFMYLFPEKPVTKNFKTKERAVADFVKKEFPSISWIYDKRITDGCSLRRPDILGDLGEQVMSIEIDEYKHNRYECSCENKRMMELSKDVGHRRLVFIRFNPDSYLDNQGNKVSSCWGINNKGHYIIKKKKKDEWDLRLEQLKQTIQYWLDNNTDKILEVIQLYYDQD